MKTKLPKTIYVRREAAGNESHLVADPTLRTHCDLNAIRIVGVYKLLKQVEVTAEVVTITHSK